jgi:hypothetical protein
MDGNRAGTLAAHMRIVGLPNLNGMNIKFAELNFVGFFSTILFDL